MAFTFTPSPGYEAIVKQHLVTAHGADKEWADNLSKQNIDAIVSFAVTQVNIVLAQFEIIEDDLPDEQSTVLRH